MLDSLDYSLFFLFWLAFYPYSRKTFHQYMNRRFYYWWSRLPDRSCALCSKRLDRKDLSLDHIIPQSICWELGWEWLIIDERNWQPAHRNCNQKRSSSISKLPASLRIAIHNRRRELAIKKK